MALEIMSDSDFDLPGASGEPIDNSIEVKATLIKVRARPQKKKLKKWSYERFCFGDTPTQNKTIKNNKFNWNNTPIEFPIKIIYSTFGILSNSL
ncbi:hypothetical protein [Peribacillus frigoritolerans]